MAESLPRRLSRSILADCSRTALRRPQNTVSTSVVVVLCESLCLWGLHAGVTLDLDAILGTEDAASAIIERSVARGVLALCSEALGVMDVAKESTLEYPRTRRQFGVPIGSFQTMQPPRGDGASALRRDQRFRCAGCG